MAVRAHSDLTVAVIHYQTPALLDRCLERLHPAAPQARLLVVDTGESEPLPARWQEEHPDVELVRHVNHSYAGAVNAALHRCRTPRFCQMNADVLVEPGTFDDLAAALEASGAAMAGPLPRDGHGRLQRQGLPYRFWQWRARRSGSWAYAPWLSGCMHYLRSEAVFRVGGMDSSLRFYNEDIEWCLRLSAAGERCVLVDSEVVHLGGSSTPATAEPIIEGLRGGYQLTRRYRGPLARRLHRATLLAATSLLGRISRKPERRLAYRRVAAMLIASDNSTDDERRTGNACGGMEESPFGATLSSRNPRFGNETAR